MDINKILGKLANRQVEGMMIHDQMSDLFNLLNLHGYKKWHENRFKEESNNMRSTKCFCVTITDKLASGEELANPKGLPEVLKDKSRKDIANKLDVVVGAFEKIKNWEESTLALLNDLYISSQQIKATEVSIYIMDNIKNVVQELKFINEELQILRDVSNIDTIIERQSHL